MKKRDTRVGVALKADVDHRFLVIGGGSIGSRHAENLKSLGVEHVAIVDLDPENELSFASQLDIDAFHFSGEAWEWNPSVVLVCTPTSTHLGIALEAARRGCHIFIEKPLSDSLEGITELLKLVDENRLVSLVGCNLRFHPGLQRMKHLLDGERIGQITSMRVEFGQYLPDWKPQTDYRKSYSAQRKLGGGIVLDAIHELDYLLWMVGRVTSVVALVDKLSNLDIDTEDTATMLLKFESGTHGIVLVDYVQQEYKRCCKVVGTEGILEWDFWGDLKRYDPSDQKWTVESAIDGWTVNQMYLDELSHFLDCLDGRSNSMKNISDAKQVLSVALAVKKSRVTGQYLDELC